MLKSERNALNGLKVGQRRGGNGTSPAEATSSESSDMPVNYAGWVKCVNRISRVHPSIQRTGGYVSGNRTGRDRNLYRKKDGNTRGGIRDCCTGYGRYPWCCRRSFRICPPHGRYVAGYSPPAGHRCWGVRSGSWRKLRAHSKGQLPSSRCFSKLPSACKRDAFTGGTGITPGCGRARGRR